MKRYILSLDQGTTSSRAIVFDRSGSIVSQAQAEFPQIYPQPGWVEHDPEAIWQTELSVAKEALATAHAMADDIAAIGIANQRETTIVWDRKTGQPVYNAIVWQCRRTAGMVDELKRRGLADDFRARTGLVLDAYFSGTKVAWILDNVPGARERAQRGDLIFGNIDSFLIWRLTRGAVHVTDFSNASRTMLFNIHKLDWDETILSELRIPRSMLPAVKPSSMVYGYTAPDVLGGEIPIAGAAGDQQAATFGQLCLAPGQAKNTYGTGCFMLMNTGAQAVPSQKGLLTTIGWGLSGSVTYCLEGSVFMGGAAVQWLRDGLRIIQTAADSEALAAAVPDSGGVYLVPAFVGLGAPYWDQYARGTIVGVTRGTTREHIVRATLEAICFQTRDVLESMHADAGIELATLRVDGGAVRNNLLMQIQANILGVPVERPVVTETTALGAAYLAGLATGYWEGTAELAAQSRIDRRFEPALTAYQRDAMYRGWQRAVERSRAWIQ
jgi:glycerol kinase